MLARPSLQIVSDACSDQAKHSRGYNVEQPLQRTLFAYHIFKAIAEGRGSTNACMGQWMNESSPYKRLQVSAPTSNGAKHHFVATVIMVFHMHNYEDKGQEGYPGHRQQQCTHDLCGSVCDKTSSTACTRTTFSRSRLGPRSCDSLPWTTDHYYSCIRCQLGRACPPGEPHTFVPKECRYGAPRYAGMKGHPGSQPAVDPVLVWKKEANRKLLESITVDEILELKTFPHERQFPYIKQAMAEIVEHSMKVFDEILKRRNKKEEFDHWITSPVHLEVLKEGFERHLQVKGIRAQLRPWHKSTAEPKLPLSSSYLRLFIIGNNKKWQIGPLEDMREMSHNQINEAIDEMD